MMNKQHNQKLKILLVAALPFILWGMLTVATGMAMLYDTYKDLTTWKEITSPLEDSIRDDICQQFELATSSEECTSQKIVYAPDFFDIIKQSLVPRSGDWATYDDVEEKLGDYKYYCEPPITPADGTEYFRCWYDLQGDQVFPILIFFNGDGSLYKMFADVVD